MVLRVEDLQARFSFLIRATYDTLPCPRNLHQWFGAEDTCPLCDTINASLQHILSGCKIALSQGCYTWQHDLVLKKLAGREANSRPSTRQTSYTVCQGWTESQTLPPEGYSKTPLIG